jgi:hypothetical protein
LNQQSVDEEFAMRRVVKIKIGWINFIGSDEPAALSGSDNCDLVFVSQGDHFLTVKH